MLHIISNQPESGSRGGVLTSPHNTPAKIKESFCLSLQRIGEDGFSLGALALGRKSIEAGESYQLREPSIPYSAHFGVKKGDIGPENV